MKGGKKGGGLTKSASWLRQLWCKECKKARETESWKSSWLFARRRLFRREWRCLQLEEAAAAVHPSPCRHPLLHLKAKMGIVSWGGAPSSTWRSIISVPPPLPFVHFCKGRRVQVSGGWPAGQRRPVPRPAAFWAMQPLLPLGKEAHSAPVRAAGSCVAGCQRAGGRLARTIALLLPAGGGGCYNIHIPPRHRHSSYCDLWHPSLQWTSHNFALFSCNAFKDLVSLRLCWGISDINSQSWAGRTKLIFINRVGADDLLSRSKT